MTNLTTMERTGGQAAGPKLWTVTQVAAALAIHARTVWRMAAEAEAGMGRFPRPLRLGPKTLRWQVADIDRYLADLAAGVGKPA